jgi:hypothetical protein
VASKKYIEQLQMVIHQLHKADSKYVESVPVHEVFRGQTVWQDTVEVFDLTGHPKAKRCYAWAQRTGPKPEDVKFTTVLEIPPVESPQTAVKVALASEAKK